jgi:hypothetical protein
MFPYIPEVNSYIYYTLFYCSCERDTLLFFLIGYYALVEHIDLLIFHFDFSS